MTALIWSRESSVAAGCTGCTGTFPTCRAVRFAGFVAGFMTFFVAFFVA